MATLYQSKDTKLKLGHYHIYQLKPVGDLQQIQYAVGPYGIEGTISDGVLRNVLNRFTRGSARQLMTCFNGGWMDARQNGVRGNYDFFHRKARSIGKGASLEDIYNLMLALLEYEEGK